MHWQARLTKYWAYLSMGLVTAIILFLFGYVFYRGADTTSWEFLTQAPSGAVLGEEGGIWPGDCGKHLFYGNCHCTWQYSGNCNCSVYGVVL